MRSRQVAGLGVLLVAGIVTARLVRVILGEPGYPLWDEAAQGLAGLDLADAVHSGNPLRILQVLNERVTWPFVHSIFLLPGFLLLGSGYATGDLVSAVLFGAAAMAAFAAGLTLHPTRGAWAGTAAAVLLLLAPAYRLFGTQTMLEIPGAFLLGTALACYARAGTPGEPGTGGSHPMLRAAGFVSAALFLTKYNYGLLWLIPLAIHEATGCSAAGFGERLGAARAWIRGRSWLHPFPLFVAAYGLFLASIVLTGGWDVLVLGQKVSIHSAGNPAYFLYVVLLLRLGARWIRKRDEVRAQWRAIPGRARTLLATIGTPLAIWFAVPIPNRVQAFASFVQNRTDAFSMSLLDRLAYYPRVFCADYAPDPIAGAILLALAAIPPRGTRRGDPARLLYLAMWVGFLATTFHAYHQPRFIFTTALLIWLSAARTVVSFMDALLDRPGVPTRLAPAAWTAALAALLACGVWGGPADSRLRREHNGWQSGPPFGPVLDWIARETARRPGRTVLLGHNVRLSPAVVAWHLRIESASLRGAAPARLPGPPAADSAAFLSHAGALLRRYDRVLAVLPTPGGALVDASLLAEARDDSLTTELLRATPGVTASHEAHFPDAGFRALVLARAARGE